MTSEKTALLLATHESDTRVIVRAKGGHGLRWATLELVEGMPQEQEYETRTQLMPPGHCNGPEDTREDWATCTTCHRVRWNEHTPECDIAHRRFQWVVRRFDWFDPTPKRDPSFQQAVAPEELRQLLTILNQLNSSLDKTCVYGTVPHPQRCANCDQIEPGQGWL